MNSIRLHPQTGLRVFADKARAVAWRQAAPEKPGPWKCHIGFYQRVHRVYPSGHVVRVAPPRHGRDVQERQDAF